MLTCVKYSKELKTDWNLFLENSKNQTFLFNRDFMDYHSDRFVDHSLMVYDEKGNLVCCFPSNEKDPKCIVSHGGLTYGSFIFKRDLKLQVILNVIKDILFYYLNLGFEKIIYKAFPRIYNTIPSDEIDYAIFIAQASLIRRDTALVVNQYDRIKYSGNIRREANKSKLLGFKIEESIDFKGFWNNILVDNLNKRFGVKPVHSADEIVLLKSRFPAEIKLYVAKSIDEEIVAGTVFFITENVAHCQYIASSNIGRETGSLNHLFIHLMDIELKDKQFFDFGIVNEKEGLFINLGMLSWKERMGGRTVLHDFYEIDTANWKKINQLLKND